MAGDPKGMSGNTLYYVVAGVMVAALVLLCGPLMVEIAETVWLKIKVAWFNWTRRK